MKRWLFMLLFITYGSIALAAAPASRPSSRPAGPRADEQVIDDPSLHFHFAVPKAWKAVPQKAQASIYVFSLPAVGESRRLAPSLIVTARDGVGDDLAREVDARRNAILERNPGTKLVDDGATTIAGYPGWTFSYDTKITQTISEKPSGRQREEQVLIKVLDQVVLIGGKAIEFVVTGDDKGLPIRRRQLDRVTSTLKVD